MRPILTIAGSDSGAGAGIQADLKAIHANGGYALTALTAVTAQNTRGVQGVHAVPLAMIQAQLDALAADFDIAAAKTGMLFEVTTIETVAAFVARQGLAPLVVDPVMVSTSGHRLLRPEAEEALRRALVPRATLLTPNLPEAEVLLGRPVRSVEDMEAAARDLRALGPEAVLVKGGHLEEGRLVDVLCDTEGITRFPSERIDSRHTHGTGCTLSAALATLLGRGESLRAAVAEAVAYVAGAIRFAPGLGGGHGPTHHFWKNQDRS